MSLKILRRKAEVIWALAPLQTHDNLNTLKEWEHSDNSHVMHCFILTSLNHYLFKKIDEININSNKEPEDTESPNKNLKEQCENLQKDINDSLETMKNDFEQFKMKSKNHKGFGSITDNPQYG